MSVRFVFVRIALMAFEFITDPAIERERERAKKGEREKRMEKRRARMRILIIITSRLHLCQKNISTYEMTLSHSLIWLLMYLSQ